MSRVVVRGFSLLIRLCSVQSGLELAADGDDDLFPVSSVRDGYRSRHMRSKSGAADRLALPGPDSKQLGHPNAFHVSFGPDGI